MPLIDRDATVSMLGENFNQGFWNGKCCAEYDVAEETIMDAPAVDAVPVVRCRECKRKEACICVVCEDGDMIFCAALHRHMNPDDFCSYGERKEHD